MYWIKNCYFIFLTGKCSYNIYQLKYIIFLLLIFIYLHDDNMGGRTCKSSYIILLLLLLDCYNMLGRISNPPRHVSLCLWYSIMSKFHYIIQKNEVLLFSSKIQLNILYHKIISFNCWTGKISLISDFLPLFWELYY